MAFSSQSGSADRRGRGVFFGVQGSITAVFFIFPGLGKGLVLAFCRDTRPGLTAKWNESLTVYVLTEVMDECPQS